MASPVGHALMGYAVYRVTASPERKGSRTTLWLCLLLAIAPDFDFLPGLLLGKPALYHQGISHSLGFALVLSLAVAVVYSPSWKSLWADWGLFFLAYASHLIIDLFGPDARPPYGIPLFWPISHAYYLMPFQIFWGVHHAHATLATTGEWVTAILNLRNVGAIILEVVVISPIILFVRLAQSSK